MDPGPGGACSGGQRERKAAPQAWGAEPRCLPGGSVQLARGWPRAGAQGQRPLGCLCGEWQSPPAPTSAGQVTWSRRAEKSSWTQEGGQEGGQGSWCWGGLWEGAQGPFRT